MKKIIILSVIVFSLIVFYFVKTNAQQRDILPPLERLPSKIQPLKLPIRTLFAGKISSTKAREIEILEAARYICDIPGLVININPIKGQTSYFIEQETKSKTGFEIRSNQSIMGVVKGEKDITCRKCQEEKDPKGCEKTVLKFPKVYLFANSKR